jgi:hypothetical protein
LPSIPVSPFPDTIWTRFIVPMKHISPLLAQGLCSVTANCQRCPGPLNSKITSHFFLHHPQPSAFHSTPNTMEQMICVHTHASSLELEPRASRMLSKHSITALHCIPWQLNSTTCI